MYLIIGESANILSALLCANYGLSESEKSFSIGLTVCLSV
jgi:phage tail protein X